jgi:hypothetical protein
LGCEPHVFTETCESAEKPEERISAFASDMREVFERVTQDEKGSASGLIDVSHLAPVDFEGMPMHRVATIDLDDDGGPDRFHLRENSCGSGVLASGGALFLEPLVELFGHALSVEDLLLFEEAHRRRRLRWKRSTAFWCSA